MSERGSFVTEYIYCPQCFEAARKILIDDGNIKSVSNVGERIIAGQVGGIGPCDELDIFECEYIPKLTEVVCHPLRVAVIAEAGHAMLLTAEVLR